MLYAKQMVEISLLGLKFKPFKLSREVCQGCPLSPLIFNLVIEVLATLTHQQKEMTGIKQMGISHKVMHYADDIVFSLQNPLMSIKVLNKLLIPFGYNKINATKSAFMAWNMRQEERRNINQVFQVTWKQQVKYLGAKVSTVLEEGNLIDLNITPLVKEAQKLLELWKPLKISWFGRIAALKKIIPKFIFIFQTLVLSLPSFILRQIQAFFSKFVWPEKTPRT